VTEAQGTQSPRKNQIKKNCRGRERILRRGGARSKVKRRTETALCKLLNIISINHVNDRKGEN